MKNEFEFNLIKLMEECGELTQVAACMQLQGVDHINEKMDESNREWMKREITDVLACIQTISKSLDIQVTQDSIEDVKEKYHNQFLMSKM